MARAIRKRSARAQAREILIEEMMRGTLAPGERLNETVLAKSLGVSQTPIREALLWLEGKGYVTSRADRGFFVKALSMSEVEGIYPVLADLEVLALSTVASFPDELLDRLDAINRKFRRSRAERSIDLDNEWHSLLLSGCGNTYLTGCIERVRDDAHRYENLFFRDGGNIDDSCAQHDEIVALLRDGNRRAACETLRNNNMHGVETLRAWLAQKLGQ